MRKIKCYKEKDTTKKMPENEHTGTIKLFKDLSLPSIKFMQMIRNAQRIQSSWNQKEAIFIQWKKGKRADRINGQYEDGEFLG